MLKLLERPGPWDPAPRLNGAARAGAVRLETIPPKGALGRSQQLLELACKVLDAAQGGVGLLSPDGELAEHIAYGAAEEVVAEMWRSSRLAGLARLVLAHPGPFRIEDLAASHPDLGAPPGQPALGPLLGVTLRCLGRYRA